MTVKIFSRCGDAKQVPRRAAALGHDNNPANQFVSNSSKYIDRASRQRLWISVALNHCGVVAGLVPATSNFGAESKSNRRGRDKPGHAP
jgi:hypothetical protein